MNKNSLQMQDQEETLLLDDQPLQFLSLFHRREIRNIDINMEKFQKIYSNLCCTICRELLNVPVFLKCSHRFCKECIEKYIRFNGKKSCPNCRGSLTTKRDLRNDYATSSLIKCAFIDRKQFCQEMDQIQMAEAEDIAAWQQRTKRSRQKSVDKMVRNRSVGQGRGNVSGRRKVKPNELQSQRDTKHSQFDSKKDFYETQAVRRMERGQQKRDSKKSDLFHGQQQYGNEQFENPFDDSEVKSKEIVIDETSEQISEFQRQSSSQLQKPSRKKKLKKNSKPIVIDSEHEASYDQVLPVSEVSASSQLNSKSVVNREFSQVENYENSEIQKKYLIEASKESELLTRQTDRKLKQELGENHMLKIMKLPHLNFSVELGLQALPGSTLTPEIKCKSITLSINSPLTVVYGLLSRFLSCKAQEINLFVFDKTTTSQKVREKLEFSEHSNLSINDIDQRYWSEQGVKDINVFDVKELLSTLTVPNSSKIKQRHQRDRKGTAKLFQFMNNEQVRRVDAGVRKRGRKKQNMSRENSSRKQSKFSSLRRVIFYEINPAV